MNFKRFVFITILAFAVAAYAQLQPVVPQEKRGRVDAERAALPMRDFGPRDYLQEIRSALRSAALVLAAF